METNTARDLEQVVRMFVEMDVGPVSPSSTTQDTSHRVQKWNVGPEYRKRLEQPCGYFGKRTPFLRWRVQLQDTREILHSAKDLGVGIASRILIHPSKTILYSILEVFTHSSRKSINHCVYINKLFSFVITEVSPNNNTDN